jgi:hypothetical protein
MRKRHTKMRNEISTTNTIIETVTERQDMTSMHRSKSRATHMAFIHSVIKNLLSRTTPCVPDRFFLQP